jgi:hypothetical protein
MRLKLTGNVGDPVMVSMKAEPENGTSVIKRVADSVEIFRPTLEWQKIGKLPTEVEFYILFHRRPWTFSVQFKTGDQTTPYMDTSSKEQGFGDAVLLEPDTISITVAFVKKE